MSWEGGGGIEGRAGGEKSWDLKSVARRNYRKYTHQNINTKEKKIEKQSFLSNKGFSLAKPLLHGHFGHVLTVLNSSLLSIIRYTLHLLYLLGVCTTPTATVKQNESRVKVRVI
jgi:uncharacterized membrane protein